MNLRIHSIHPSPWVVGIFLLCASHLLVSCSVVVGNVKPVDEKSTQYGVMDLGQLDSDWVRLDPEKTTQQIEAKAPFKEPELNSTEIPDAAYQSRATASIISIDSACRHANETQDRDLKTLTNLLFLGMTDLTLREEKGLDIQNTPALETTLRGKLNGEPMMIRTVVLKRDQCVFDLVYMARPQFFYRHATVFSHFVASLHLKE